jgi:hypothetical protein
VGRAENWQEQELTQLALYSLGRAHCFCFPFTFSLFTFTSMSLSEPVAEVCSAHLPPEVRPFLLVASVHRVRVLYSYLLFN